MKTNQEKIKLYIDADGTLFEWKEHATLYDLTTPGYYRELNPYEHIKELIEMYTQAHPEVEVYIATHYLETKDDHIIDDKKAAFKKHYPFIDESHFIFIPYGIDKNEIIPVDENSILIDDHTPNLFKWENAGGHGIKVKNFINGHGGKWKGDVIYATYPGFIQIDGLEKKIERRKEVHECTK